MQLDLAYRMQQSNLFPWKVHAAQNGAEKKLKYRNTAERAMLRLAGIVAGGSTTKALQVGTVYEGTPICTIVTAKKRVVDEEEENFVGFTQLPYLYETTSANRPT